MLYYVMKMEKIINEFHTDGNKVAYEYENGKMKKSSDSFGYSEEYYTEGGALCAKQFKNGKEIGNRKFAKFDRAELDYINLSRDEKDKIRKEIMKERKLQNQLSAKNSSIARLSTTSYENYYVNGYLLNDLMPSWPNGSMDYFFDYFTMTEAQIQSFLQGYNSILKDTIQVWAINSSNTVYNTGRTCKPSKVIFDAQNNQHINAKVILVTLQKESSLVQAAPGSVGYNNRRFYFAMGAGATDSGDVNSNSGFDNQISIGADKLVYHWLNAPSDSQYPYKMTVNNGVDKTSNSITYKGYIWVKNYATYALFKYTPWTIDTSYLPTITGGNYKFAEIANRYWSGNWGVVY